MFKKIKIPLLCLIITVTLLSLMACAVKYEKQEDEFVYNYNEVFSQKPDDGYNIDGVLDEAAWKDKNYYNLSGENYSFKLTTHFSDSGLYAAVIIEDGIYYRQLGNFTTNTSFNLNFKVVEKGSILSYSADLINARRSSNSAMKSKLTGKANEGKAKLTFEMYTTWQDMGAESMPTQILVLPSYHRIQNEFDANGVNLTPAFSQNMKTSLYLDFDKNGFCQADKEGAILGDSCYGVTKSSGWDVSRESDGIVRSYKKDYQAIFFKNAFYDSFIMQAKITPVGGINDADPRLGLMTYVDFNTFKATMLYGRASNLLANAENKKYFVSNALSSLTFYPDGNWHWANASINTAGADEYINGLTLKMVKVKDLFLYIINDKLVCAEQVSYLGSKTLAGFYSLGMEAEFSECKLKSLEGDADATSQELAKYGYTLSLTRAPGGSVSSDKVFIDSNSNTVTLTVSAASGYEFSGLTKNGVDIFEEATKNINADGSITLSGIDSNLDLHFIFSRIEKPAQNLVSGIVSDSENRVMDGIIVVITDSVNKYNSYRVVADISGNYKIALSNNSTYDVTVDGGVNYHVLNKTFTTDSSGATTQPLVLQKKIVGGFAGNLLGEPGAWDLSSEQNGIVKAKNKSNGRPIFFTDFIADNALIKATIKYTPVDGGETSPAVGFAIGNDSAISRVMLMGKGVRILRYGHWGTGDLTDLYNITDSYDIGGQNASQVTFAMIRRGENYYLFTENNGELKYFYTIKLDTINTAATFGFVITCNENLPLDVEYSNYSVKALSDTEADEIINAKTKFAFGINNFTNGSVSVSGESGGVILGGAQTITITPESGHVVTKFTIDGVDKNLGAIDGGSYNVKHIFSRDTLVVVEFVKSVAVNGKVAFDANNYSTKWSLGGATLTFSADGYADITATALDGGDYTAQLLANLAYTIIVTHDNTQNITTQYTTTTSDVQTLPKITLGLANVNGAGVKPDEKPFNYDLNWQTDASGKTYASSAGDAYSIISGGYGDKFIVEATFTKNSGGEWAGGGFRFTDGNNSFNVFVMKDAVMISNNTWPCWDDVNNESIGWGVITNISNSVTVRIIKDDTTYYILEVSGGKNKLIGKIDDTKQGLNKYKNFTMPNKSCNVALASNCAGGNAKAVYAQDIKFICDSAVVGAEVKKLTA